MHYGDTAAVDTSNKTSLWSEYGAVWHLEETTGQAMDSAKGNNLTPVGSISRNVEGRVSGAELFNDSSDRFYVYTNSSAEFSGSLTLEGWVYLVGKTSDGMIVEKAAYDGTGREYGLYVNNGNPRFVIGSKITTMDTSIETNQWVHITGVFDTNANTCKIFVNGILKKTSTSCSDNLTPSTGKKLLLGSNSSGKRLNGAVDEVRVLGVARSDQWVRVNHLSQTDGFVSYGSQRNRTTNFDHVLMTIKTNDDDGQINVANSTLSKNGTAGIIYPGSTSGRPLWGYYRFQLPKNIPANATVKKVMLRLYGRDKIGMNNKYLVVTAQNSANSLAVSNANQYPGGSAGVTSVAHGAPWGNPSIAWTIDEWNESPELKQLVTDLITNHGSMAAGANIQLWVARAGAYGNTDPVLSVGLADNVANLLGLDVGVQVGTPAALVNVGLNVNLLDTLGIGQLKICLLGILGINCSVSDENQVGTEDSLHENINHGQLMIEWE